ncbi:hypothetical protein GCM10010123_11620 [Pilimelia anulata]|uniref:Endonuclease/exonuclease/phosphatase family protein n=1 Tax=Pilimelia anulata TaxID=53371 RepID=A0A8J3FBG7_9ACTN|nr:hypothetical protein [Pilimelia anulata]GGJ83622.1 hypothetical protein GCM10010123_11620 [Pilimelia anulata]
MPSHGPTRALTRTPRTTIVRFSVALAAAAGLAAGTLAAPAAALAAPAAPTTSLSGAAGPLAPAAPATAAEDGTVLQVNLCNSGYDEDCYDKGKSVPATVALVKELKPVALTLNEACRSDVDTLFNAMRTTHPGRHTHWAFAPISRADGHHITCATGGHYGSAVIDTLADMTSYNSWAFPFDKQAAGDERRIAHCSQVVSREGGYFTCGVQLAAKDRKVANAQCKQLVGSIMDRVAGKTDYPIMAAGTFNLRADGMGDCLTDVADDYTTAGKGLQHLVASEGITLGDVATHPMSGTGLPGISFDATFDGDRR